MANAENKSLVDASDNLANTLAEKAPVTPATSAPKPMVAPAGPSQKPSVPAVAANTPGPPISLATLPKSAAETVNKWQESVPKAEEIREEFNQITTGAYEHLRGGNSTIGELSKFTKNTVELGTGAAASLLSASVHLLSLQPLKATRILAEGVKDTTTKFAEVVTSPFPITFAATRQALNVAGRATSAVTSLPGRGYLAARGAVTNGYGRLIQLFESDAPVAAPSATPANPSSPPPVAAAA